MGKLIRVSAAVLATGASLAATAPSSLAATPAAAPPCPVPQLITIGSKSITIRVACGTATIPTSTPSTTVG